MDTTIDATPWKQQFTDECEVVLRNLHGKIRGMYEDTGEVYWLEPDLALLEWRQNEDSLLALAVYFDEEVSLLLCLVRHCSRIDELLDEYDGPDSHLHSQLHSQSVPEETFHNLRYLSQRKPRWMKHFQTWLNSCHGLDYGDSTYGTHLEMTSNKIRRISKFTGNFELIHVMQEALTGTSDLWHEIPFDLDLKDGIEQRLEALEYLKDSPQRRDIALLEIAEDTATIKELRMSTRGSPPIPRAPTDNHIRHRSIHVEFSDEDSDISESGQTRISSQPTAREQKKLQPLTEDRRKQRYCTQIRTSIVTCLIITSFIVSSILLTLSLKRGDGVYASGSQALLQILQAALSIIPGRLVSHHRTSSCLPLHFIICTCLGALFALISTVIYERTENWSTIFSFLANASQATGTIIIVRSAQHRLSEKTTESYITC